MQRDELKDLVKDEDALNKIMAMHGKDVTKFKEQQSELETKVNSLSENLTAANKQLEDVKQSADDEIKAKISAYQAKADEQAKQYQQQLNDQKKGFLIREQVNKAGARDYAPVAAMLDLNAVSLTEKGELLGLSEQLDKLKQNSGYLFKDDKPKAKAVNAFPNANPGDGAKSLDDMDLASQMALYLLNVPGTY